MFEVRRLDLLDKQASGLLARRRARRVGGGQPQGGHRTAGTWKLPVDVEAALREPVLRVAVHVGPRVEPFHVDRPVRAAVRRRANQQVTNARSDQEDGQGASPDGRNFRSASHIHFH
jgi:hypothetical protein